MRITITAVGSRGDIQPYVALAVGFKRASHEVRLSAPQIFAELITEHGLQHLPIQAVADKEMRQRAAEIGQVIEAENGVDKTVEIIERYLAQS